jgi:hypothetical protein
MILLMLSVWHEYLTWCLVLILQGDVPATLLCFEMTGTVEASCPVQSGLG